MPDAVDPMETNPDLRRSMSKSGVEMDAPVEETGPKYQIYADTKIAVSCELGKLWESRKNQSKAARRDVEDAWSEAIRYFDNDQMAHRGDGTSPSRSSNRRKLNGKWTATENVVYANITTMLPTLYAKNPQISITALNGDVSDDYVIAAERLVNTLLSTKHAPGVNAKPKARRAALWALLTNSGYSKVGFVDKEDSSEEAINDLRKLSLEYENAKTQGQIKDVEGKIAALEERISFISPSGPSLKTVSPFRLHVDPGCVEPDHTDAQWILEEDYLPTVYINAVYTKKQDGKTVSLYEPTHILKASVEGAQLEDDVNNFSIFNNQNNDEKARQAYGYKTDVAYKNAQYTKVYWIWDKTTRRVFLFADNKWAWPLWVWDDPLKLIDFFPYDHLEFHTNVEGSQSKGEVTYYLDQQDNINDINSTIAQIREWVTNNVLFDKNVTNQDDVEKVLSGPSGTAKGVDVPEGKTLKDVIFSFAPPALSYPELLSTDKDMAIVNRMSGVSEAQRGGQYKTNTTNDAVAAYQANVDIRIDEKIDQLEDFIGSIGWKLLQMVATRWDTAEVAKLIGVDAAKGWVKVDDVNQLRTMINLRVIGGSTEKPTSKNKKKQVLELGQILGQFGAGLPAVAIVVLKMIERAFRDEVVITQDDWSTIFQSLTDQANAAGGGPGAGGPAGGAGPPGGGQQQDPAQVQEQIKQLVATLPPDAKAHLEELLKNGVPPQEALKQVQQYVAQNPPPKPAK